MDPLKEYGYIALLLVVLGAVVWFAHDERVVGEAKVEAAQRAADAHEEARVAQVNANATTSIQDLQTRFAAALATPPKPAVVVRLCPGALAPAGEGAPGTSPLSGGDAGVRSGSGVGSNNQGIDIATPTESILKRDQTVITYLQGYIRTCQTTGGCAK